MSDELLYTFQDAVDKLTDYVGAKPAESARKVRVAVLGAYDEMPQHFRRNRHFLRHHRLELVSPVSTGTVTYDHDLKELTFSDTPPDWVQYGRVKIADRICDVKSYVGYGNTVMLDDVLNPGADIATATAYELRRYEYPLPGRFRAVMGRLQGEQKTYHRRYSELHSMLEWERMWETTLDWKWSLDVDPDRPGGYMVKLFGHPDAAESLDLMIHQRPRKMRYTGYESMFAGSTTVTNEGREVTASAAIFTANMVGSILRFGTTSERPEGEFGVQYPYAEQGVIESVDSDQQVRLIEAPDNDYTAVKFRVTDPIDLPSLGSVTEAFWRCCEWKYGIAARVQGGKEGESWTAFREALKRAMGDACQYDEAVDEGRWPDGYADAWPADATVNSQWGWF